MEIQEEKVMWIRKIGLGILIGVVLCSVMVNAEERNSRKAEPMTVMERMREIPHKIYEFSLSLYNIDIKFMPEVAFLQKRKAYYFI